MAGDRYEFYGLLALFFGAMTYVLYFYSERFLEWLRFQSIGTRDYIVDRLALMFIEVSPNRVLLIQFLASFGVGAVVFTLFAFAGLAIVGGVFAALLTILGWKLPRPIVDFMYNRRLRLFEEQMIDGLGLMSNGMKSGLSVVQAIGLVVKEMQDPIKQEFNLVLSQNRMGVSIEESFNGLAKRVESDDVEMFVTSINILKETGGNLSETFDTISGTIRERLKLEKKIGAMTAMGFYQGMMLLAAPVAIGFYLYTTDPDMMRPLFTTNIGWGIVIVVLLLMVLAYFAISKIVKIDV